MPSGVLTLIAPSNPLYLPLPGKWAITTASASWCCLSFNKFKKLNVEIFGISRDSLKSHENFKKKYNFPFELLSDHEESASTLFNVIKMKNMYGKKVRGIERSTFLINPEGKLIHEWRGVKVNGHIEEILKVLNNLGIN